MTDGQKQNPHYIPELDPAHAKFGGDLMVNLLIYYFAYGISSLVAVMWFFAIGKTLSGSIMVAFGLIMFALTHFYARNGNQGQHDASTENPDSEGRIQSPHYIAALDPEHKNFSKRLDHWLLWLSVACGFVAFFAAIVSWQLNLIGLSAILTAMGFVLISPIFMVFGFAEAGS